MDIPKIVQLDFGFECEPIAAEKKALKPLKVHSADFVFDFMDCVASPIIVFESAWKDTIPVDMLSNVKLSRLLASIQKEETATLTEALVFMMPRTFESPMSTEWVNIYTWLGLQYARQFHNEGQVNGMLEIAPQELTDHENGLLDNLRTWIYNQRRKALKARLKNSETPKTDILPTVQGTLFKK